jgi:signal transduction histidine kinase
VDDLRRDETQARGVTVTADLGAAPALGDPRLAERLAANLADNAIRYNVPGGQVEITAGRRDDRAFLAVTNTGPVIPPDQLGRLFQPFERLAEGRRASGPGTDQISTDQGGPGLGLGLAIVSAIAAAHGAALHAVTRAAGGLAIEVVFPPRPADQAITDQTSDRPVVLA